MLAGSVEVLQRIFRGSVNWVGGFGINGFFPADGDGLVLRKVLRTFGRSSTFLFFQVGLITELLQPTILAKL